MASPFADLVDNESKGFMNDLKDFTKNRLNGLESAYAKLAKNVEVIYNDNFVNFYYNLENNSKQKGFPDALKQKIKQIQMNGGKEKLDMEVKILNKSSEQAAQRLNEFKSALSEEESFDNAKRNQYGQKWRRQPSNQINRNYFNEIDVYEKKSQQADSVNKNIIQKYHNLAKYIAVVDGTEQQISSVLPKVEVTKFIEDNRQHFDNLKSGIEKVNNKKDGLDSIVDEIRRFYEKMNYTDIANKYYKQINETNREKILDEIFHSTYKLIDGFNNKVREMESEAQQVGKISGELNQRNKGDDRSKKEFEEVMAKFNDISNLYRELGQGTAFYTKLSEVLVRLSDNVEGFTSARRLEAQELEASLGKGQGGFGGGNSNLPSMYPNQPQQNLGFYVPPPMVFSQMPNQNQNQMSMFNQNQNQNNMGDMLNDLMRSKPNFSADVFGGQVYKSKFM